MKPDWDKLMGDFADSKQSLVADVDCTADGKDLCETHAVKGFPTIKYGDPSASLTKYEGPRDYDGLKKFADENLGPTCGPDNVDLCNDADKASIEKFKAMSEEELDAALAESDAKMKKIEDKSEAATTKLNIKVESKTTEIEVEKKKCSEKSKKETKKIGLGVQRKVLASRKKQEM